jgi:uncharacterized protein YecT (DUF1311 family)
MFDRNLDENTDEIHSGLRINVITLVAAAILAAAVPEPAWAQTQGELTEQACGKLRKADAELNRVYQKILAENANDADFVKALREAQRAWVVFRDAHVTAIFPATKPMAYGSVNPMCRCSIREQLTVERTKQLQGLWIDGTAEGDVCAGSSPIHASENRSSTPKK